MYGWGKTKNSCVFRQVYSLHLIKHNRQGFAVNRPDPVRILGVGSMTSHSHHNDRANSTGGVVAWLLKFQCKMLGDAYLPQCFTGTVIVQVYNIVLPGYSMQAGQEMWLLWG